MGVDWQIEDLGEKVRQRLERVRVLKFYPQNPLLSPESRSKYVNRSLSTPPLPPSPYLARKKKPPLSTL